MLQLLHKFYFLHHPVQLNVFANGFRFSLCWIFCVCKVFNNPNERDISLLGVVPRHQQANYQPHSGFIPCSLTQIPNPGFQRICVVVSSIPFHLQKCSRTIFSCTPTVAYLTAMRPQQSASNTGCLLFCLPSQLFKNSISYLRKNHLLYRLHFSVSFISFEFATTKDQWTYNVQRLCP